MKIIDLHHKINPANTMSNDQACYKVFKRWPLSYYDNDRGFVFESKQQNIHLGADWIHAANHPSVRCEVEGK